MLAAPISLVSQSILDVFKQRASADFGRTGNCRDIYIKTLKSLAVISLGPTLVLMFLSPFLFRFVFGKEWVVSGYYAQIMSVMFFFRFIASPLGFVIDIAGKQAYDLIWQAALFVFTIASFVVGVHYRSEELCFWCYSVSYTILYIVYLIISYRLSNGEDEGRKWIAGGIGCDDRHRGLRDGESRFDRQYVQEGGGGVENHFPKGGYPGCRQTDSSGDRGVRRRDEQLEGRWTWSTS